MPLSRRLREPWLRLAHLRVWVACLLFLGWGAGLPDPAPGAEIAADHGTPSHAAHHDRCGCAERCKGARCCCGRGSADEGRPPHNASSRSATRPPAHTDSASHARAIAPETDDHPCLRSAPCGGGEPNVPGPGVRILDRAALLEGLSSPPAGPGARLAPHRSDRPRAALVSRLDDPPESATTA